MSPLLSESSRARPLQRLRIRPPPSPCYTTGWHCTKRLWARGLDGVSEPHSLGRGSGSVGEEAAGRRTGLFPGWDCGLEPLGSLLQARPAPLPAVLGLSAKLFLRLDTHDLSQVNTQPAVRLCLSFWTKDMFSLLGYLSLSILRLHQPFPTTVIFRKGPSFCFERPVQP